MDKYKMEWNRVLKYSWAHVLMVLAGILLTLCLFMGIAYAHPELPEWLYILTACLTVILFVCLFVAQRLKGTKRNFAQCLKWERILLLASILLFVLAMWKVNYFLLVAEDVHTIRASLTKGVESGMKIFDEYDTYTEQRLDKFEEQLRKEELSERTRTNQLRTLELQLRQPEIQTLKEDASKWREENASTKTNALAIVNPYLINNTDKITSAFQSWTELISKKTEVYLKYETEVYSFEATSTNLQTAKKMLQRVKACVQKRQGVSWYTLPFALVVYVLLLLPYLVQERNTKARRYYSIFGTKSTGNHPEESETDGFIQVLSREGEDKDKEGDEQFLQRI